MRDHLLSPEELQGLTALSAAAKLQVLEALGFVRYRSNHERSCASLQASGYICTCIAPQSVWSAPEDVYHFLGESLTERKAYTERRNVHDNDGEGPRVKSWRI